MNPLKEKYLNEVVPAMQKQLNLENPMQFPKIEKVVVNIGLGEALDNPKALDAAVGDLTQITGQKPIITKARVSIANYKLREGRQIGAKVTLRGERMWEFADRLISVALPRIRDFRGVSNRGFDRRGNYTLGIKEHTIFPELLEASAHSGMDITFVTSSTDNKAAKELLVSMGMPFAGRN